MNGTMTNNLTFDVGNARPCWTIISTRTRSLPALIPAGNAGTFDYGLPFFYGKRVAVAVQGAMTTVGTGPYIAF